MSNPINPIDGMDPRGCGLEGTGWTGVTPAQKNTACGRDPADHTTEDRMLTAAWNAERVAFLHGDGHWLKRSPSIYDIQGIPA